MTVIGKWIKKSEYIHKKKVRKKFTSLVVTLPITKYAQLTILWKFYYYKVTKPTRKYTPLFLIVVSVFL